jgi:DNA-binding transcriptional LysR family regulator
VTLTASDALTISFLIPALPGLRARHPGLRLDIVSSNQVLSLARREADIALRMVRPDGGDLLTRRIATMGYGLYATDSYLQAAGVPSELEDLAAHSLIDWVEEYPKAATFAWFRELTEQNGATLRLNGSQERLAAVAAGLGIGCLPFIVAREAPLRRVLPSVAVPHMEVWMLTHPDSARVRRVRAVMDYLAEAALAAGRRFSKAEASAPA